MDISFGHRLTLKNADFKGIIVIIMILNPQCFNVKMIRKTYQKVSTIEPPSPYLIFVKMTSNHFDLNHFDI